MNRVACLTHSRYVPGLIAYRKGQRSTAKVHGGEHYVHCDSEAHPIIGPAEAALRGIPPVVVQNHGSVIWSLWPIPFLRRYR